MAASWIWESGGDYIRIDENGEEIVFNRPNALRGLKAWMEVYRMVPEAYASLNQFNSSNSLRAGGLPQWWQITVLRLPSPRAMRKRLSRQTWGSLRSPVCHGTAEAVS